MRTTLTITGMSCVHCKRAVFTALAAVPGIIRAEVSLGRAEVEHDGSAGVAALKEAVAAAGYEVTAAVEDRRMLPQVP